MLFDEGAVFVMPRPSTSWAGASALWITVAGWAAAAERRLGKAWVVTPDAVATPERVLDYTAPRGQQGPSRTRGRWLPRPARTAVKDMRELLAHRKFKAVGEHGPWNRTRLRFVWQQHDLFPGPGAAFARDQGVPYVCFVHAPQVWEAARWGVRRPGWGRLIERFSERPHLRRADVVACVSEEVAQEVRRLGVSAEKVLVSPMSVDSSRFSPSVDGEPVRRRLGLGDGFVFGWTGSFRKFHGLDLALRAFARLHAEAPDTRLLLVGHGLEMEAVKRLAVELGVAGAVVFPGAVSHLEVPRYVAALDAALVVARDADSFHYSPLKLREYMLCAKPVVVPAAGEMLRVLRDGVDAVQYAAGSVDDLHRKMRGLWQDRERAVEIGREGRRVMAESGTWDAQLDRLLEALAARGFSGSRG